MDHIFLFIHVLLMKIQLTFSRCTNLNDIFLQWTLMNKLANLAIDAVVCCYNVLSFPNYIANSESMDYFFGYHIVYKSALKIIGSQ